MDGQSDYTGDLIILSFTVNSGNST
jgi:hypothetical protein